MSKEISKNRTLVWIGNKDSNTGVNGTWRRPADVLWRNVRPENGIGSEVVVDGHSCMHSTIDQLIAAGVEV